VQPEEEAVAELQVDVPQAHLLVHAGQHAHDGARPSLLRRFARQVLLAPRAAARAPVHLSIDDLAGHRLLDLEHVGALLDIALPAGTYHVTARQGAATRRYTMTLAASSAHELHLRLPGP
jgi:hypothetical protein